MYRLLHVGCGPQGKEVLPPLDWENDWTEVRIDTDPAARPDIVDDIATLSKVPDGYGHFLFSKHNIEHLETFQVAPCLANFRRVLDPAGFAIIRTPNLRQIAEIILEQGPEKVLGRALIDGEEHPIRPLDLLFGDSTAIARGNRVMARRTAFTPSILRHHLEEAGFEYVEIRGAPETHELLAIAVNRIEGNVYWPLTGAAPPAKAG